MSAANTYLLATLFFSSLVLFQVCVAQPTISVEELINGSPTKTTTLEFESTTTRSIDLVPLLSFSIVCEIKGNDQFTSTPWTVDGTSLDQQPSESMAYYTSPTSFQRQLVFQNFSSTMSGNYTCTTIDGSRTLLIGESNPTVVFSKEQATRQNEKSDTLTIDVFLAGIPYPQNISVYFNGIELTRTSSTGWQAQTLAITWYSSIRTFIFGGVYKSTNEGNYYFALTNSAGTSNASFYLNILNRPDVTLTSNITVTNKQITVSTGTHIVLTCTDRVGDPVPDFMWTRDSELLSSTDSISIEQITDHVSQLTITDIQPQLAGLYKCRASNNIGGNEDTVTINVKFAPVVVPITPQYNNITIGQPIQLLVLYEGGYPIPNVTWSRIVNGELMDALAVTRASVSGALGLNLTITNSTLEDDLMYVLTVNNTVGSVTLNFTVSILVPPVLVAITNLTSYRRTDDCVTFSVNISDAEPPVTHNDLIWIGSNNFMSVGLWSDGISTLHLCNLTVSNTGPIVLRVHHSANNVSEIVFQLYVWNPPFPPSPLTAAPIDTCTLKLYWTIPTIETNTAVVDKVKVESRFCPLTRPGCTDSDWVEIDTYSVNINSTTVSLLPNKVYKFRATSNNSLIGFGAPVFTTEYISSEVRDFQPLVQSLTVTAINSSSLNVSWRTPLATSDCYNISEYEVCCKDTSQQVVFNDSVRHIGINVSMDLIIYSLHYDEQYNCSVLAILTDVTNTMTSLGIDPQYKSGYTLPLPPNRPNPPSVSSTTNTGPPNTITIDLFAFNVSINSQNIAHIRLLVLRLGSTPTLPDINPDILYPSDDLFSTYEQVHNSSYRGKYPPYVAAEFTSDVPAEFIVGTDTDNRKRQVSIENGQLAFDSYYTMFIRVYAKSKYGNQYTVFNSTTYMTPMKPVLGRQGTPSVNFSSHNSIDVGVAVGVSFVLLLCTVAALVAVFGVVCLVMKRRKKVSRYRGPLPDTPPEFNTYTAELNGIHREKSPISSIPLTLNVPNASYDKLEPAENTYIESSTSPPPVPCSPSNERLEIPSDTSSICDEYVKDYPTPVPEYTAAEQQKHSLLPCFPVARENFQSHLMELDANDQELFDKRFSEIIFSSPNYPATASLDPYNILHKKNRYKNITAFDETRVRLQEIPDVPHSDYINANYIKGYDDNKLYIATQGPNEETYIDFWRMVWEQHTATIVMLTNIEENGKPKCYKYWPDEGEQVYNNIVVRVDRNIVLPHYTIRGFKVFNKLSNYEERTVLQFHYTAWPDKNVPALASPVLDFLRAFNSANKSEFGDYGPIVVHCSAGVGRTGTIIALDIALEQLKAENIVDVSRIVKFLRQKRTEMVQVLVQFIFIHHAVLEDIVYGDTSIQLGNFADYYNRLGASDNSMLEEYEKIGAVKPPAQARTGPHVVYIENEEKTDMDSFNAHYLDSYWLPNLFITSSCPSTENLEQFWKLVWSKKCTHVINLSPKDATAFKYVPSDASGKEMVIGSMRVMIGRKDFKTGFISRIISITNDDQPGCEVVVHHMEYQDWLVNYLPRVEKLVKFVQECLREIDRPDRNGRPMLIHDDGSRGPVGVFATLCYCFQRAKKERIVDLLQAVNHHHLQCPGLITTLPFYAFCYDCLKEYIDKLQKEESVPHLYENIASFRGKLQPSPEPVDEDHQVAINLGYDVL